MDCFDSFAAIILDTAQFARDHGHAPSPMSFLLNDRGGWEIVERQDVSAEQLRRDRCASAVYLLRDSPGGPQVETARGIPRFDYRPAHPYSLCGR